MTVPLMSVRLKVWLATIAAQVTLFGSGEDILGYQLSNERRRRTFKDFCCNRRSLIVNGLKFGLRRSSTFICPTVLMVTSEARRPMAESVFKFDCSRLLFEARFVLGPSLTQLGFG